jgi:hypothetical protein
VLASALAWGLTAAPFVSAAVVAVNDCGNNGAPLRAAISAAGAGDVIVLPACTIVLAGPANEDANAGGDLDISVELTIVGAGPAQTIIDGGGVDRVIHVLAGASATIVGLTIRNGVVVDLPGGGLYADR